MTQRYWNSNGKLQNSPTATTQNIYTYCEPNNSYSNKIICLHSAAMQFESRKRFQLQKCAVSSNRKRFQVSKKIVWANLFCTIETEIQNAPNFQLREKQVLPTVYL